MSDNLNLTHLEFTTFIRVRYAETDQMGYCYYGNYASYFEVARVEALRDRGVRQQRRHAVLGHPGLNL